MVVIVISIKQNQLWRVFPETLVYTKRANKTIIKNYVQRKTKWNVLCSTSTRCYLFPVLSKTRFGGYLVLAECLIHDNLARKE